MPIWVTEYAGMMRDPQGNGIPSEPALVTTQYSSGSSAASSTITFAAGTNVFVVSGDVAAFFTVGSSTAVVASSSQAQRIPANVPTIRARGLGAYKLVGYST